MRAGFYVNERLFNGSYATMGPTESHGEAFRWWKDVLKSDRDGAMWRYDETGWTLLYRSANYPEKLVRPFKLRES